MHVETSTNVHVNTHTSNVSDFRPTGDSTVTVRLVLLIEFSHQLPYNDCRPWTETDYHIT